MKPTPDQITAGMAAADRLKERGDGPGCYPVSFTKNPRLYVERIAEAVLALVPEPKTTRKRKP
jgi:hypothetical protein